jgi:hypothetical protein
MAREQQELAGLEREVVSTLIDTKAVDFEALGRAVAKFGPAASLIVDGEDWFCGTMKWFIRFYRLPDPIGPIVRMADLAQLREIIGPELRAK